MLFPRLSASAVVLLCCITVATQAHPVSTAQPCNTAPVDPVTYAFPRAYGYPANMTVPVIFGAGGFPVVTGTMLTARMDGPKRPIGLVGYQPHAESSATIGGQSSYVTIGQSPLASVPPAHAHGPDPTLDDLHAGLQQARQAYARGQYGQSLQMIAANLSISKHMPVSDEREHVVQALIDLLAEVESAMTQGQHAHPQHPHGPHGAHHTPEEKHFPGRDYDPVQHDLQRIGHQAAVQRQIADDQAEALTAVEEARLIPHHAIRSGPHHRQPRQSAPRRDVSKYGDGVLYASPEYTNPQGRVVQTVMYDISDLTMPVPHHLLAPIIDQPLYEELLLGRDGIWSRPAYGVPLGIEAVMPGFPFFGLMGGRIEFRGGPATQEEAEQRLLRLVDEVIMAQ